MITVFFLAKSYFDVLDIIISFVKTKLYGNIRIS
jgi:hypothetical protein